ncbi:MAG: HAMP domain-containing sensor histidine kinase, partial [Ferruginibacter sp.]
MKRNFTIFSRFAIVIFSLIAVMSMLFIIITYFATVYYHQASTQLLNKDVAAHIAEFTSPYSEKGINKAKADSVFKDAMVLCPGAEVYFLDTSGKVIAYHSEQSEIAQWLVPLTPIKKFIATRGEKFIKGLDPKEPKQEKIFSTSEVKNNNKKLGFIYVILMSKKSESIMGLLYSNHVVRLALIALITVILLSLLISFIYLKRFKKNFAKVLKVLERFERGEYNARFNLNKKNELEPVTDAFNKMADLLSSTISKLTHSEEERKNFIASISHDLRTPLSIARGYTETLLFKTGKNITPEERENYSHLIYAKMLQIENMVKQLFELSKMEAVEFKTHKEPFVLSEIVQESANTFQLIAAE